jgi:rhamnose utilization protein RhaD (predicted bifunctional aldolase and dehydrogenase)
MTNVNSKNLKNLVDLSLFISSSLDLIQGAGGNTSVKDENIMWIKASGCWLSDAKNKEIFIPLDRKVALKGILKGEEDLSAARLLQDKYQNLRPSIEAAMHALMPHKFVAHVHSVNVIAHAILINGKDLIQQKLTNLNWLWVPYVRPGLPLSRALHDMNASEFDVIILANHGLVVGGSTKSQVLDTLAKVEEKLFRPLRTNLNKVSSFELPKLLENIEYKIPKHDLCQFLATDKLSLEIVSNPPLYPDHVIFLGPGAIPILSLEKFKNKTLEKSLHSKVVIIKDFGVVVRHDFSENAEEMLHCLANVLLRIQPNDKLEHLKQSEESELLGWDAEKYRKSIQR